MRANCWKAAGLCTLLLCGAAARAQQRPLLSGEETTELFSRAVQLMESTAAVAPELARAGAPVTENARQALITMRTLGLRNAPLSYTFLTNLRAYLALADALPRSFPFPEEGRKQFLELREVAGRIESHFQALLQLKETQLRNPDRDNLRRYADANAKLPPPVAGRPRVVFLGDSITDFWRLNEYFSERDFVNRGISGQITGEMLGRMMADVIDLKPAAVLILAGTNDLARGVPVRTVENNLALLAELAQFNNIRPLLASVPPISDYHKEVNPGYERSARRPPGSIRNLNDWIQGFCRQHDYAYVDYFSALVDKAGYLRAELADDGLHPNSGGYRLMAPVALAAIGRALGPQRGKRSVRK